MTETTTKTLPERQMPNKGTPHTIRGPELTVGQTAPDFQLTANDWSTRTLNDYAGKIKLISVVPSIDTGYCDKQTRLFNETVRALGDNVVVLTVSADLPFAQRRWCGNSGLDNVITLSTSKDMQFSDAYGTHDLDMRINQRAVFVVDADNVIRYVEYVPAIAQEVDYEAATAATKQVIGG